jgi:hypothetical protein
MSITFGATDFDTTHAMTIVKDFGDAIGTQLI